MQPSDLIKIYSAILNPETTPENEKSLSLNTLSLHQSLQVHQRFKQAMLQLAELHMYSQKSGVGGGLLIVGPSGVGKTTILKNYLNNFPPVEERHLTVIPVLHVVTPSSPTVKSLAESILIALRDPMARRGSAEEKTFRIYQLLKVCKVELILFDEFQHCFYAHSINEFRRVTDWLKNVISVSETAVVLFGLAEAEAVVSSNEQLARRFSSKLKLTPFRLESDEDFQEFRAILKGFQSEFNIELEEPFYEANLARRFLIASNGLLDYLRKILEGAFLISTRANYKKLELSTYGAAFRMYVWPEVSDRMNPFHLQSPLRYLDRPGEPYYLVANNLGIGSPLARRSIYKMQSKGG